MRTDLAETHRPSPARPLKPRAASRLLLVSSERPQDALRLIPLAFAAREAGYEVHLALLLPQGAGGQDGALTQLRSAGLPLHEIELRACRSALKRAVVHTRALHRLIQSVAPRLVHAVGLRAVLMAGMLARLKNVPALLSPVMVSRLLKPGSALSWNKRQALGGALRFVFGHPRACVQVQSPQELAVLREIRLLDLRRSFLSRGMGADLRAFHPRPASEARPAGPPVVMLPAELIDAAALQSLIDAARALRARARPARFVLIGTDIHNRGPVQKLIDAGRAEALIEWWELADDLAGNLRRADAFCLPLSEEAQGPRALPALIAAAASGLPLVAGDCAPVRDVVRGGLNGLLVPPGDAGALELALERVVTDSAFRLQAGLRSREMAAAEFALDASITALLTMYRAVLTGPAKARRRLAQSPSPTPGATDA